MKKIVLIFFILLSHFSFSQLSKKHFIPPLTYAGFGNANPDDQYIYLSTPNTGNVPYTITPIGQPTTSQITGIVSNTNPERITIGAGDSQLFIPSLQTSKVTNNKGYIIEAEAPIYVSVRMNAGGGAQAGALVSKGKSALGTTFRVGTYTNQNPQDNYLNFVSVMATEDNTQVTFSDLPSGLIIKNYTGVIPIPSITLNEGETYTIATNSSDASINRDGLIGGLITSDKPIVVNCGSANGSFHNGNGRDYGIDQIADLDKVGNEYILVKGDGNNDWENILVVAHTNNTEIFINGETTATATINAGNHYLIEGNEFTSVGNMYIRTSEDVFVYQGVGATNSEANQGMFFVPPLSCETRGNIDNIANIDNIGFTTYTGGITIVTKKGANVTVNNAPITSTPRNVDGKADYVTYKITGLTGNISVQGDDELYVAYFNFNGAATSGSFYSGFPTAPEINFDAQFTTLGNCIPNITLEAANAQNFDSFEWLFDNGSGIFTPLTNKTPNLTPTLPGKYKLIGVITCTGEKLESVEVPVSICPDDTDKDGIIDNLDVDNDNDGILNCTESNGDLTINLTNTNNPTTSPIFVSTSSTFLQNNSSGNNTANTLTGSTNGDFTSTIQPDNNAESTYTVSFTELINVKFMETGIPHVNTDGESFIAQIAPANKNITLVDPDNRLLVDSNFDGIFETGITQISGSEIRFQMNPTPNGNRPYIFYANQVEEFTFTHKLINNASTSTFNGNISLTCYKLDSDGDGVKDEFDYDSDNDGIPDSVENTGTLVLLSNNDTDTNGLDDVYDVLPLLIDTDNDGILDYLDLDSDNDGIYDIRESGQLGTIFSDTDDNGIEDSSSFGTNGWLDTAETDETTPSNNEVNYSILDTDNDTVFNYIDSDSDGDNCSDVIEAGFSDTNEDNFLGNATPTIDTKGRVTNASDGYTAPSPNHVTDGTITITTQPANTTVCEDNNTTITFSANPTSNIQWELSTDNGANWAAIANNSIYSGATTNTLTLTKTPLTYNNYQYRAFLNRTDNSCGIHTSEIILTVNPLPIVSANITLTQCDDDTDGFSAFNLTEANEKISTNATNETFTYYTSQAAAIIGDITSADYIADPTKYINATLPTDVVWANIKSSLNCSSISEIQLNVSVTQIPASFQRSFYKCDDFLDINGNNNTNNDKRDGIASFNFSSVTNDIINLFPSASRPNLSVHYYRNDTDALAEENEITDPTNYRNIGYPNTQQIYVRVDNGLSNDCLGLGAHITLIVEALPTANPVTIARQCDDDQDGLFPFNSSQIETNLLNGQNPADVTITYFDENNNPLPSPLPNPFLTTSQTITIRVTNNTTLTNPAAPCYDETTLEFIVDKQPIANPVTPIEVCDGSANDIDDDGRYPFDTSGIENTVLGTQTGMDIFYTYIDENNNTVTDDVILPNPLVSTSQTISVRIENPINRTCTATTSIDLIINPLPKFTIKTPDNLCSSDPNPTVILEVIRDNPPEDFDYQWEWISVDNSTTEVLRDKTTQIIMVSTPGTYRVTLTKKDGTGCSKTKDIVVIPSEKATITLEDIEIEGLSDRNTIKINDANNNLGLGDYEYAIEDEFSTLTDESFFTYQDSPIFNDIFPGIYQLYIRDKNGCGTTPIKINVIGFLKFFTPNGDGYNDEWCLEGVNNQFQPNTLVFIFDRYGKLLKQIRPGAKWDGTINGKQLPASDYWFSVTLEDGRTFKGHFALKR